MEGVELHILGEASKVNRQNVGFWSTIKSWFPFRFRFRFPRNRLPISTMQFQARQHSTEDYAEADADADLIGLVEVGVDVIVEVEISNPKILEALSNSLILTEIFKILSLPDLFHARLVNNQWKEIATYVMIDKVTLSLGQPFSGTYPGKSHTDLFNCIESSDAFPCANILLEWDLGSGEEKKTREDRLHLIGQKLDADTVKSAVPEPEPPMTSLTTTEGNTCNPTSKEDAHALDSDHQLLRFIRNHGCFIKSLSLRLTFDNVETVLDLFLLQLPNLEYLRIFEQSHTPAVPIYKRKETDFTRASRLLSLKTIFYCDHHHYSTSTVPEVQVEVERPEASSAPLTWFEVILKLCPNLEEIKCFNLRMTNVVSTSGKIQAVKSFGMNLTHFISTTPNHQTNIDNLVRFAAGKPQLEELNLWMTIFGSEDLRMCPAVCNALEGILISSQHSLKRLRFLACHHFPGMKLPPSFPNLKCLTMCNILTGDIKTYFQNVHMFPPGYILKSEPQFPFPSVHSLFLNVEDLRFGTLAQNFQDNSWKKRKQKNGNVFDADFASAPEPEPVPVVVPFSSVKVLKFLLNMPRKEKIPKRVSDYLQLKFPNVNKVVFTEYDLAGLALRKEMYYLPPTVESVELAGMHFNHDDYEFDSFFLGITKQVCKKLLSVKNEEEKELEWETHKTSPNIRDFHHLKKICIKFDNDDNDRWADGKSCYARPGAPVVFRRIITPLSWELGFRKMPDCEITFMYDEHCVYASRFASVLKPIAPYVQIRSCD